MRSEALLHDMRVYKKTTWPNMALPLWIIQPLDQRLWCLVLFRLSCRVSSCTAHVAPSNQHCTVYSALVGHFTDAALSICGVCPFQQKASLLNPKMRNTGAW